MNYPKYESDEDCGYDMCDPKHPTWLERFNERADYERDLRKENGYGSGDVSCASDARKGD